MTRTEPSEAARKAVSNLDQERSASPQEQRRIQERREAKQMRVLQEMIRKVVREELVRFKKEWRK